MSNPIIKVQYSQEQEIKRVADTLKKIDWFTEHGYADKLLFPKNLSRNNDTSLKDISDAVINEYSENVFREYANSLEREFEKRISIANSGSLPISFLNEYIIILTRYGTGGSYTLPNKVIINILKNPSGIRALLHEIIHLSIEKLVKEYSFNHAQKERVVDLLFKKIFPDTEFEQKRFIDQKYVNDIFDSEYPNIERIFSQIKSSPESDSREG